MTSVDSSLILIFCVDIHMGLDPLPPSTCVHLSLIPSTLRVDVIDGWPNCSYSHRRRHWGQPGHVLPQQLRNAHAFITLPPSAPPNILVCPPNIYDKSTPVPTASWDPRRVSQAVDSVLDENRSRKAKVRP